MQDSWKAVVGTVFAMIQMAPAQPFFLNSYDEPCVLIRITFINRNGFSGAT